MDSTELQGNKESETNNQLLNLLGIIYFKSVLKLYKFVLLVPEIHIKLQLSIRLVHDSDVADAAFMTL